jgi:hypothetical protein
VATNLTSVNSTLNTAIGNLGLNITSVNNSKYGNISNTNNTAGWIGYYVNNTAVNSSKLFYNDSQIMTYVFSNFNSTLFTTFLGATNISGLVNSTYDIQINGSKVCTGANGVCSGSGNISGTANNLTINWYTFGASQTGIATTPMYLDASRNTNLTFGEFYVTLNETVFGNETVRGVIYTNNLTANNLTINSGGTINLNNTAMFSWPVRTYKHLRNQSIYSDGNGANRQNTIFNISFPANYTSSDKYYTVSLVYNMSSPAASPPTMGFMINATNITGGTINLYNNTPTAFFAGTTNRQFKLEFQLDILSNGSTGCANVVSSPTLFGTAVLQQMSNNDTFGVCNINWNVVQDITFTTVFNNQTPATGATWRDIKVLEWSDR